MRVSQRRMVECDLSSTRLLALTPMPSARIFRASDTIKVGVRMRAIGVPVLSRSTLVTDFAQVMLNGATILETVFTIFDYFWALAVETLHESNLLTAFILYATN